MRMRRKKNLFERLNECAEYLFPTEGENLNALEAVKNPCYIDYCKEFGNTNPIELEIGCGMGGFIIEKAKLNKDINYIAIEKINNVLITACENAQTEKLSNIKFINTNAACLQRYIKNNTLKRIYLNFSNPLPRSVNEKQRLTSKRFLDIYKKLIAPGGEIHQKTDDRNFFEYSILQFIQNGYKLKNLTFDLHKSDTVGNIMTEHEKKFLAMGLPIHRLEAYLGEEN